MSIYISRSAAPYVFLVVNVLLGLVFSAIGVVGVLNPPMPAIVYGALIVGVAALLNAARIWKKYRLPTRWALLSLGVLLVICGLGALAIKLLVAM